MISSSSPSSAPVKRNSKGLLQVEEGALTPLERFNVQLIQKTLSDSRFDQVVRWCQRHIGARWIELATRNVRHIHGLDRLPPWNPTESYILVSNHRSFFDLYLVTTLLVLRGLQHRILFPVRSNFFYDHPLGAFVNGAMSFFAMYPPMFRDRKRAQLNLASVDEVIGLLRRGGMFVGLHPEGTRNKSDDPYALLPAQSGVGRIIRKSRVKVIPVFVNGLTNNFVGQIGGNATRRGTPVVTVFGSPIDFNGLLDASDSPRTHKAVAERAMEAIQQLAEEERAARAKL